MSLITLQSAFVSELELETVFALFVVDLMHEFELGVWKAVLMHIIRVLYTLGASPFSDFFPMTHGSRIVTNPHDPWGMHWCTLAYTPWVMGYYFPTFYGSYHTLPDYGFPMTHGVYSDIPTHGL